MKSTYYRAWLKIRFKNNYPLFHNHLTWFALYIYIYIYIYILVTLVILRVRIQWLNSTVSLSCNLLHRENHSKLKTCFSLLFFVSLFVLPKKIKWSWAERKTQVPFNYIDEHNSMKKFRTKSRDRIIHMSCICGQHILIKSMMLSKP